MGGLWWEGPYKRGTTVYNYQGYTNNSAEHRQYTCNSHFKSRMFFIKNIKFYLTLY